MKSDVVRRSLDGKIQGIIVENFYNSLRWQREHHEKLRRWVRKRKLGGSCLPYPSPACEDDGDYHDRGEDDERDEDHDDDDDVGHDKESDDEEQSQNDKFPPWCFFQVKTSATFRLL